MLQYLKAEFLAVKDQDSLVLEKSQGINYIEDDTIAGNSDYLLFISKELAACKDDVNKAQNPFVVGKLDVASIETYDFKKY